MITAWALCFLTALHEVTMSSLLYGPGSETLAVVVLNSADLGRVGVTAALSVLVTAVVVLPASRAVGTHPAGPCLTLSTSAASRWRTARQQFSIR